MGSNGFVYLVSVIVVTLSFVAVCMGKMEAAIYIMLNAIYLQQVIGNMEE